MARYIEKYHLEEFEKYWEDHWNGKAEATEAIKFFADSGFPSKFFIMRVEK